LWRHKKREDEKSFKRGKALAKCLGKLGYPVLSREENLATAAKTYRISEEEVSTADVGIGSDRYW
jgi:hypothetical protein